MPQQNRQQSGAYPVNPVWSGREEHHHRAQRQTLAEVNHKANGRFGEGRQRKIAQHTAADGDERQERAAPAVSKGKERAGRRRKCGDARLENARCAAGGHDLG